MSISDRLNKLTTDITNAYTSIENKGGTIPANKNTDNLHTAIDSIEVIEQATAEGESLSLANTKAMPYSDYVVKGKSEQETRSGKNLFSGNFSQFNSTGGTGDIYAYFKLPEDNETYTLTLIAKNDFSATQNVYIGFTANGGNAANGFRWVISPSTSATRGQIFTFSTNTYRYISLYYGTSTTLKTLTDNFYIQLEKATSYTSYEDYGVSPSPEYPSEIHSVADDVNLWDGTITNRDYVTYINGVVTQTQADTATNLVWKINFFNNSTYVKQTLKTKNDTGIITFEINKDDTFNKISLGLNGSRIDCNITINLSFLENNKTYTLSFNITNVTQGSISWQDIKFQEGEIATPYSPYNQGTVTIKQRGKNKFDLSQITENHYIASDGSEGSSSVSNTSNYIFVEENKTYVFYYNYSSLLNSATRAYCLYNKNKVVLGGFQYDPSTKKVTFTPTEDGYIRIAYDKNCTDINLKEFYDKTFQTYPLRSLPNGVKDSKDTKQHTRVGVKVFDGSENTWELNKTLDKTIRFRNWNAGINSTGVNNLDLVSDYFIQKKWIQSIALNLEEEYMAQSITNDIYFSFNKGFLPSDTLEGLKTWLSSNPVTVLYPLATETIESLTQNQATTMLDIIKTGSYEGTTNIYTDEDVKPTIGVGYYKKG